jgi:hypothetical protein
MSSDEDGVDLMAAFKSKGARKATPPRAVERRQPSPAVSDSKASGSENASSRPNKPTTRRAVCVRAKPLDDRSEYVYYEPKDEVESIVREFSRKGDVIYEVRLFGDRTKQVSESGKGTPWSSKGRAHVAPAPEVTRLYNHRLLYHSFYLYLSPLSQSSPGQVLTLQ